MELIVFPIISGICLVLVAASFIVPLLVVGGGAAALGNNVQQNGFPAWAYPWETQLRIRQCLIARPGSTLAVIRRVASHPVALAQCRQFFAEHPGVEAIATYDTAGSVMDLLRDGPATQAAIGPALAASLYGGQILLESIEDDPENYTRFLLLARESLPAGAAESSGKHVAMSPLP